MAEGLAGLCTFRWDTRGTRVGEGRMVGSEVQVGRANRGCEGNSGGVVVWCGLSWLSCMKMTSSLLC